MFLMEQNDVSSNLREQLRRQDYKRSQVIDGVKLIDCEFHADDGGEHPENTHLKHDSHGPDRIKNQPAFD